jgi:hypothetical protein
MRTVLAVGLFTSIAALLVVCEPATTTSQEKKEDKKAQQNFDPPKTQKPDAATLKQIAEKTEQLRQAIAALKAKKIPDDVLVEVEVYLKAAENIVRFDEWYTTNSGKWALQTLDEGHERAKQAEDGKPVWRFAPGKWVVRAYRSVVDSSIQPYAVLLPHDYEATWTKVWRVDVVLHGRDSSLTEAKFIATHGKTAKEAPKELGYVRLEVYGRGNNAYRWAGETDVLDARDNFYGSFKVKPIKGERGVNLNRCVLRGFSMGGAGTWHIGLHHPSMFCVIGPGAGFTTTHGYVGGLPKQLPDYQEKCLHIYDAVDYTENAFNVPIVAYSGEKDAQKKAADNIENALKAFNEPHKFTHLIAPGLEHQMPKEWQDKAEVEYAKYVAEPRNPTPSRVRFVTYTPRYGSCDWVNIRSLDETYVKAVIDGKFSGDSFDVKTNNIRRFDVSAAGSQAEAATSITIDGQNVKCEPDASQSLFEKRDGKWVAVKIIDYYKTTNDTYPPDKHGTRVGPIDDAFRNAFQVVKPTGDGFSAATDKYAAAAVEQFGSLWDRYFRGALPVVPLDKVELKQRFTPPNLVLFGDPKSNPLIAKLLPKLPITWTEEKLIVNGVEYSPKTHIPVLIYPCPTTVTGSQYVVINTGHTFKEADLKGTNALLYPRLGDWAVIKPTPTEKDPAAYEVVAAGLFDENWHFPMQK